MFIIAYKAYKHFVERPVGKLKVDYKSELESKLKELSSNFAPNRLRPETEKS